MHGLLSHFSSLPTEANAINMNAFVELDVAHRHMARKRYSSTKEVLISHY